MFTIEYVISFQSDVSRDFKHSLKPDYHRPITVNNYENTTWPLKVVSLVSDCSCLKIKIENQNSHRLKYTRSNKINLVILVEGDPRAPFSIAITPGCRGGRYSIPRIASPYPHIVMLSGWQSGLKYHFLSLWYDSTGRLNPGLPELANTLLIRPMAHLILYVYKVTRIRKRFIHVFSLFSFHIYNLFIYLFYLFFIYLSIYLFLLPKRYRLLIFYGSLFNWRYHCVLAGLKLNFCSSM